MIESVIQKFTGERTKMEFTTLWLNQSTQKVNPYKKKYMISF